MENEKAFGVTINSDAVRIPVVRNGKNAGTLVLHPDDMAFLSRFYALLPRIEQHRADLASALQGADAGVSLTALNAACDTLREEIDAVFGAGTSALVFGKAFTLEMAQQFFAGVGEALRTARETPKLVCMDWRNETI